MIPDRLQASGADKVPSPSGSCNCSRCADGERVCGDPPVRFADDLGAFTAPGEERPSEMRSPGGRNCRRGEGRARNGSAAGSSDAGGASLDPRTRCDPNWSSCVVASSSSGWPRASHELREERRRRSNPSAKVCKGRATLGTPCEKRSTLQGLHLWTGIVRFNPCGVGALGGEPRVSAPPSRPRVHDTL
ncbi:MAG: hypothetical protein JWQ44_435 [Chthoniobacter sp.]|nr:hypothetical protein [Chthoniobacter sp.]